MRAQWLEQKRERWTRSDKQAKLDFKKRAGRRKEDGNRFISGRHELQEKDKYDALSSVCLHNIQFLINVLR